MPPQSIVIFDGLCTFCDRSVQFIIKRDPAATFTFASAQGATGQALITQFDLPAVGVDTLLLWQNGRFYFKSDAALRIARQLHGAWPIFYPLILIPRPIRDFFYTIFANNRYRWFGRKTVCAIPPAAIQDRFLT